MNRLTPEIITWAQQGVVPAALKIAAAMEESGLGAECPAGSNNWFGIKAANGVQSDTREQTKGGVWYTIRAGFHVFKTPADGFAYYDWLISNGAPYAVAWKAWLASPQTDADVEALTRAIAARYATALSYAKALVSIEVADKLFGYDQTKHAPLFPYVGGPATTALVPAPHPSPTAALETVKAAVAQIKPVAAHEGWFARLEAFLKDL